eukprot:6181224-Pleurochrysis_carterae.AAC.1
MGLGNRFWSGLITHARFSMWASLHRSVSMHAHLCSRERHQESGNGACPDQIDSVRIRFFNVLSAFVTAWQRTRLVRDRCLCTARRAHVHTPPLRTPRSTPDLSVRDVTLVRTLDGAERLDHICLPYLDAGGRREPMGTRCARLRLLTDARLQMLSSLLWHCACGYEAVEAGFT